MKASRLKTALLGSGAAVALVAAGAPASADEISDLRQQIEEMQDRVAQIEAQRTEERRVASAAAVEAGDKPRSWVLPGTNTSLTIGGYAKLDLLWDFGPNAHNLPFGPEDSILVFSIPAEGSPADNVSNGGTVRMHARQSRFWIRTWTPTDWGELATHIEGDFFGGASLSPSNSNGFRLRHAYGRLGPVLAGQTWTTWMPLFSLPELLDFSGPSGDIFVRQAQIRYTHSFGNGWSMQAAIEDPFAGRIGPLSTYNLSGDPSVTYRPRFPDIVVNIAKNHNWLGRGRIGAGAVVRDLNYDTTGMGNGSDSEIAWGAYIAMGHAFNDRFRMGAQGSIGEGVGKYMLLATGTPQAVITAPGGSLNVDSVFHIGGLIWAGFSWADNLRSTVAWGYNHFDPTDTVPKAGIPAGITVLTPNPAVQTYTLHANLIWSPVPQANIGVEYTWRHANYLNGPNGTAHRLQFAMQWQF